MSSILEGYKKYASLSFACDFSFADSRLFSCSGEEVSRLQFSNGGNYSVALREGSFEIFGDRVTKLGTNM